MMPQSKRQRTQDLDRSELPVEGYDSILACSHQPVTFAAEDEQIPVWLDCDPGLWDQICWVVITFFSGHDDAFAIILCGHNPCLHLLGISTVGRKNLYIVT